MSELENRALRSGPQLDLFAAGGSGELFAAPTAAEPIVDVDPKAEEKTQMISESADIDADALTPREALALVYELQQKAKTICED